MPCKFLDLKSKSVILVGNGPSLKGSEKGSIIDQFDEIIRFNKYKIKGFEKDVGSKTTVWSTFGHGEMPGDKGESPNKIIFIHGYVGKPAYEPEYILRIPLIFYKQLRTELQQQTVLKEIARNLIPSSGILVISYLLETFLDSITIVGFDFFNKRNDLRHHYWANLPYKRPKEHDGGWEYKKMMQYKLQGKIKIL